MKKVLTLMLITGMGFLFSDCSKKGCTDSDATNYCSDCKSDDGSCVFNTGCMDADANNYCADCKRSDGSCTFTGKMVFWYGKTSSDKLVSGGHSTLTYYVDGILLGSTAANIFWTGAPNCGQNGSISSTKSLGTDKTKQFSYSVKDEDGTEIWAGKVTYEANHCIATELTY